MLEPGISLIKTWVVLGVPRAVTDLSNDIPTPQIDYLQILHTTEG